VGGGQRRLLLMDTGSLGIVFPRALIHEYTPIPNSPSTFGYSSSGHGYNGGWVWTTVKVSDLRNSFTTGRVQVFAVDSIKTPTGNKPVDANSEIGIMGIGLRGVSVRGQLTHNVFLNLPEMQAGAYPTGYLLDRTSVTFGYDPAVVDQYTCFHTDCTFGGPPTAEVSLTPPPGSALQPYTTTGSFLLDTGLTEMIVTPRAGGPLPDPAYQTEIMTDQGETDGFVPGVTVGLSLQPQDAQSPITWTYDTSDYGQPGTPAYARFAIPSAASGMINSGLHLLERYDYLAQVQPDLTNQSASNGIIGFKPATS
jgi:hypothetical protein